MPAAEIRDHETGLVSGPFSWFQSRQLFLETHETEEGSGLQLSLQLRATKFSLKTILSINKNVYQKEDWNSTICGCSNESFALNATSMLDQTNASIRDNFAANKIYFLTKRIQESKSKQHLIRKHF